MQWIFFLVPWNCNIQTGSTPSSLHIIESSSNKQVWCFITNFYLMQSLKTFVLGYVNHISQLHQCGNYMYSCLRNTTKRIFLRSFLPHQRRLFYRPLKEDTNLTKISQLHFGSIWKHYLDFKMCH